MITKSIEPAQATAHYTHEDEMHRAKQAASPIVMACDESYAMQVAVALRSALDASHGADPLNVHVLCSQFSTSLRQKVIDSLPAGLADIHWIPVDLGSFKTFSTLPHISKMTFARFMIPNIFPESVRRVLYLDADILVLQDLRPLWETDLRGAVVGAVKDHILDSQIKADARGVERFPRVQHYFNAGVLLIDLGQWRKHRISEQGLEYLKANPDSPLADQDALNVACDGRWLDLGVTWNFYDHFKTRISKLPPSERPRIAHFVGQKPWKASKLSVNADLYDMFRQKTCFARRPADKLRDEIIRMCFRVRRRLGGVPLVQTLRAKYLSLYKSSSGARV